MDDGNDNYAHLPYAVILPHWDIFSQSVGVECRPDGVVTELMTKPHIYS
jgi:hypothetical protein